MLVILSILLVLLILNAIFMGGVVFDHNGGFEWSTTNLFEDIITDGYAQIRLGGEFNDPKFYIPFVFFVYGIESPPYPIRLAIRDNTGLFKKFFMESISIEYADGQKIERQINWERDFKNKFSNMTERYVIDKLPITIDRRRSCKIRFRGYFVNKEDDKVPFDTTKSFEYEAYEWKIYPVHGSL